MKPSCVSIFSVFFTIGCQSFGGYMAIISMVERELVRKRKWITREDLMDSLVIGNMLPGPIAVNVASVSGYLASGWKGFVASWLGLLAPAFATCLVLAEFYSLARNSATFTAFSSGILVAVVAVIASSIRSLTKPVLSNPNGLIIAAIAGGIFLWNPFGSAILAIAVLYLAAFIWVSVKYGIRRPDAFRKDLRKAATILLPLLVAYAIVVVVKGYGIRFQNANLDLVCNLAASSLMLFGGAYSFIPIVGDMVVEERQWMTMESFMDSVAIGQISPGPVLIASAYIGYSVSGFLGAVLATVALFLPPALAMLYASKRARKLKGNLLADQMFDILKPIIVGVLVAGVLQIGLKLALPEPWLVRGAFVATLMGCLWLLGKRKAIPIVIIFSCGTVYGLAFKLLQRFLG